MTKLTSDLSPADVAKARAIASDRVLEQGRKLAAQIVTSLTNQPDPLTPGRQVALRLLVDFDLSSVRPTQALMMTRAIITKAEGILGHAGWEKVEIRPEQVSPQELPGREPQRHLRALITIPADFVDPLQ